MRNWFENLVGRFTWAQRFLLASLVILGVGMVGVGAWVGQQIESGVVHQSAANAALFVSSMVEPHLQALAAGQPLTAADEAALARLAAETSLGQQVTAIKVWDRQGRIVYATDPAVAGQAFAVEGNLARALRGWVAASITALDEPENALDRDRGRRRLETYSPVRRTGTSDIIAAVEFYQTVEALDRNIAAAQRRSWLIVGLTTGLMYLLLAGFVRVASDTIRRQQNALRAQVLQVTAVLHQNRQLHERVRRAAQRTTALNERFLRRISAELHDGPSQDLGLALLRLDRLRPGAPSGAAGDRQADFELVRASLQNALQEIRALSAGMGLPQLENITLAETAARAVRAHERRTGTQVALTLEALPAQAALPLKITVYRIIQEALANAQRHAGGLGQRVTVGNGGPGLRVLVEDQGPGFDETRQAAGEDHLGLVGMRERVESLGGVFRIESGPGQGTRVSAQLPLDVTTGDDERKDPGRAR